MKAHWKTLEAKFAALQQREKRVVAIALLAGVGMVGHDVWVNPASTRLSSLEKQVTKNRADIQSGQEDLKALAARLKDLDAPNKAALAEVKSQIAVVDRELRDYERVLIPPERVQELLRSLLARHRGLELVSLQTLAPAPLVSQAAPDGKPADPKAATPKNDSIHKQGLEIRIAGNYLDLLSYVSDLEHLPQKLLWGSMSLAVTNYPKSELTLTVFTLSPDSRWLVL